MYVMPREGIDAPMVKVGGSYTVQTTLVFDKKLNNSVSKPEERASVPMTGSFSHD